VRARGSELPAARLGSAEVFGDLARDGVEIFGVDADIDDADAVVSSQCRERFSGSRLGGKLTSWRPAAGDPLQSLTPTPLGKRAKHSM
jgi:hypothetical protein